PDQRASAGLQDSTVVDPYAEAAARPIGLAPATATPAPTPTAAPAPAPAAAAPAPATAAPAKPTAPTPIAAAPAKPTATPTPTAAQPEAPAPGTAAPVDDLTIRKDPLPIQRRDLEAALGDFAKLGTDIGFTRVDRGVRLGKVASGSYFWTLGLRPG